MTQITVQATIQASVDQTWECWTSPVHIVKWCFASNDWHCPTAINNLEVGGRFNTRMEAKDGSVGFDFEGTYTAIEHLSNIRYTMDDSRTVSIRFEPKGPNTLITETFDAETENPLEMQQAGWQAILNQFKLHTESVAYENR